MTRKKSKLCIHRPKQRHWKATEVPRPISQATYPSVKLPMGKPNQYTKQMTHASHTSVTPFKSHIAHTIHNFVASPRPINALRGSSEKLKVNSP
jgi:hypothetical protein